MESRQFGRISVDNPLKPLARLEMGSGDFETPPPDYSSLFGCLVGAPVTPPERSCLRETGATFCYSTWGPSMILEECKVLPGYSSLLP